MTAALSPDAWESSDPLGQALHFLRMTGTFYCYSELSAPWGLSMPAIPRSLMFHVVISGECRLSLGSGSATVIRPGELVLVPHGRGHDLMDRLEQVPVPILDLEREHISPRYERLSYGGGGQAVTLVCGAVQFEHPAAFELARQLPEVIHVRDWPPAEAAWIRSTLELMQSEAESMRPGGETVMTRLADILVIQAIRTWIESAPEAQTGWLRALHDPRIGRAIMAIHRDPGGHWSVESLADHVGMSRSAFAARFSEMVGETPAAHLVRWRMQLASAWLREESSSIAEIAERLGYSCQAAFSRAFKRSVGIPPSRARAI